MTGVDRDPRPVRLAGGDQAPPGGILQHGAEPGDGGERRDDAGHAGLSRGPRQGRSGPEGAGRRRRTATGAGRLQGGARGRGVDAARQGEQRQARLVRGRAHAREGARQVMAVDEHQAGRAEAREPRHELPPLAAAGHAGPARHDEIAVASLQSRARPDVTDDDPGDRPVEARATGQQTAAVEEAGARQVADPQRAVVHPDRF